MQSQVLRNLARHLREGRRAGHKTQEHESRGSGQRDQRLRVLHLQRRGPGLFTIFPGQHFRPIGTEPTPSRRRLGAPRNAGDKSHSAGQQGPVRPDDVDGVQGVHARVEVFQAHLPRLSERVVTRGISCDHIHEQQTGTAAEVLRVGASGSEDVHDKPLRRGGAEETSGLRGEEPVPFQDFRHGWNYSKLCSRYNREGWEEHVLLGGLLITLVVSSVG